ncbi:MAG: MBL fold metallo-hydrolase, partial [Gemmatimonadetes bacterium]|nr:MBL fold metallo-hydrolase [Gemmatimonadota bacterium]NIR81487.1 MBL fold metallo-hydrolase [Gemmatimonadota bacterium]NIT90334.1 MBL fold metallo-hydrolase [Gemmatimonadota bacterium]NIU34159.1 MBL fold metallo-hydrolase [Gemmatimonadota bacterium]NIU38310.1 MBL fold metallo-hydrolase [Gemmatimonadota bacterium]
MRRAAALALTLALLLPPSRWGATDGAGALGAQEPASRTRVVLLGTGTPNAEPERWGPAVAVVVDSVAYLVDAGPGVVRRAAAAARRHGLEALRAPRLGRVFLTHLHSDHTLGLPDLMLSPWVLERPKPLRVWGPPGTEAMTDAIGDAWTEDIRMRVYGLEPRAHNAEAWEARVAESR